MSTRVPPPPVAPTLPAAPQPFGDESLADDEVAIILKGTLLPKHFNDTRIHIFINSYCACRSKSQAARDAGFSAGYGHTLVQRTDIYEAIKKMTLRQGMKYGYDENEVIERVKEIADVDPIVFYKSDGTYIDDLSQIPPEVRRAIKSFKVKNEYSTDPNGMQVVTGKIISVELESKMKAHELMGKEKKLFKDTKVVEHDVTARMADVLLASTKKAEERKRQLIDVTPVETVHEDGN